MGCSGKCCAVFNYPVTPAELRERDYYRDDRFLADMLIELTPEQAQERALRYEVDPPEGYTIEEWATGTGPVYTCRHWDEETMLCGAYEERPTMCRDYPYGRKCQHDCGCDEGGNCTAPNGETYKFKRKAENSNPSGVSADAVSSRSCRLDS